MRKLRFFLLSGVYLACSHALFAGNLMVSANDGVSQMVDGAYKMRDNPSASCLTLLDCNTLPPRIVGNVAVEHSVYGPPSGVALTPDETVALVSNPVLVDPKDPNYLAASPFLQVVDLTRKPLGAPQKIELPTRPWGLAINSAGTQALVVQGNGIITKLRIAGQTVTKAEAIEVGTDKSRTQCVAYTPDGRWAMVTKRGEDAVAVLRVEGEKLTKLPQDIAVGSNPVSIEVAPNGKFAVVANIENAGKGPGSVSLVDLAQEPFRATVAVPVAPTPEALAISPDSRLLAVGSLNGANQKRSEPVFSETSLVQLFDVSVSPPRLIGKAPTGFGAQGVQFTPDSKHLVVQNYTERELIFFEVGTDKLVKTPMRLEMPAGPVAIRMAPVSAAKR